MSAVEGELPVLGDEHLSPLDVEAEAASADLERREADPHPIQHAVTTGQAMPARVPPAGDNGDAILAAEVTPPSLRQGLSVVLGRPVLFPSIILTAT